VCFRLFTQNCLLVFLCHISLPSYGEIKNQIRCFRYRLWHPLDRTCTRSPKFRNLTLNGGGDTATYLRKWRQYVPFIFHWNTDVLSKAKRTDVLTPGVSPLSNPQGTCCSLHVSHIGSCSLFYLELTSKTENPVGLLGRGISPSRSLYLHRTAQHRETRAWSGVRTHDPSVHVVQNICALDLAILTLVPCLPWCLKEHFAAIRCSRNGDLETLCSSSSDQLEGTIWLTGRCSEPAVPSPSTKCALKSNKLYTFVPVHSLHYYRHTCYWLLP
jgi:hypothetical protein